MSEQFPPFGEPEQPGQPNQPQYGQQPNQPQYPQQPDQYSGYAAAPPAHPGQQMYGGMYGGGGAPLGTVRSTAICIVLALVTCGIYTIYYYYKAHEEMKQHSGQGIGGVIALVLALFVGFVSPYVLSNEVGMLRQSRGQEERVSAVTGLWFFPGIFILVGPFIWFVKTNGALNDYWISQGAQPA